MYNEIEKNLEITEVSIQNGQKIFLLCTQYLRFGKVTN